MWNVDEPVMRMPDRNQTVMDTRENRLVAVYFRLSLPVVLSSVVTILYNLADTYFIAQTNNALLVAGVSVCAPIFMILMAFGNIFGQGGSSLISRLLGQGRTAEAGRVSAFCFWISLVAGAVIGGLLLVVRDPFLVLLGSSTDTLPYAREYGTVMLAASPLVVVSFIHMNLLRCEGMAGISMAGSCLGAAVNMILDPLLIPSMGASGAAIASVTGYLCTELFLLGVVLFRSRVLSVRPVLTVGKAYLREILAIGVTAAITNIAGSLCTMLINQRLLFYGDDKIAAMGIVLKVTMIVQMILVGFSFGGIPLFGYLSGAGERRKIRTLMMFCMRFLVIIALIMTALVCLAAGPVLHLITPDPAIVETGIPMLRWQAAGSAFAGIVMLSTCICQATGRALPALVLSLSRQGILFAVVLLFLSFLAGYRGILCSQCVSDVLSTLLVIPIMRNG